MRQEADLGAAVDLGWCAKSMELGWLAAGGERRMWSGDGAADLELRAMGRDGAGRGAFGIGSGGGGRWRIRFRGVFCFFFYFFTFFSISYRANTNRKAPLSKTGRQCRKPGAKAKSMRITYFFYAYVILICV